jgi:hypothetical protein
MREGKAEEQQSGHCEAIPTYQKQFGWLKFQSRCKAVQTTHFFSSPTWSSSMISVVATQSLPAIANNKSGGVARSRAIDAPILEVL